MLMHVNMVTYIFVISDLTKGDDGTLPSQFLVLNIERLEKYFLKKLD